MFARIDISNFFYSVSRRRVKSALGRIGIGKADFFSKWSTVANPYGDPAWALPYGFVQSPCWRRRMSAIISAICPRPS